MQGFRIGKLLLRIQVFYSMSIAASVQMGVQLKCRKFYFSESLTANRYFIEKKAELFFCFANIVFCIGCPAPAIFNGDHAGSPARVCS
jgi:hypothetical protein